MSFPSVGLTANDSIVAGLRERVKILDQARVKAAAELSAKEQQGLATSRDQEHFKTVTEFIDQQIAESCRHLVEKGGIAAVAEMPCPNGDRQNKTGKQQIEKKSPVDKNVRQASAKEQEKVVKPEGGKKMTAESVQPELPSSQKAAPVKKEKVAAVQNPPQQQPTDGFFAAIRRWWEALFAPKSPPVISGSASGHPEEQASEQAGKTTAAQKKTRDSGDSIAQQAEQNSSTANEAASAITGKRKQSDNSEGTGKVSTKAMVAGQEQDQQQQGKGVPKDETGVEKDGKQGKQEQVAEKGANKAETAKADRENISPETSVAGGSATMKQKEVQDGENTTAISKAVSEQKTDAQKAESGTGRKIGKEAFSSGAGAGRTAVTDPEAAEQVRGQEQRADQQIPVHPSGQSGSGTGKKQAAPVESGSAGETKKAQQQKQGVGTSSAADAEVRRLEQSLNEALGEFDGKLLSEQERLAARIPKQREGSVAGSSGYGAEGTLVSGGGGGVAAGGYENSGNEQGEGRAGAGGYKQPGSVSAGGGKPASSGGRTTIGTDDDIVARQLREAAEKEDDPELKEKLWQEYRKYKQGGG